MRRSLKTAPAAPEANDPAGVLDGTEIRIAYKIGYVLNFYREPAFRKIETRYGITRPEIVTLIFLACRDGATARDICRYSGHLKANISRGIIALEGKGLLRRERGLADSRLQKLHITQAGRALYRRYMPALRKRERAMLGCLDQAERAAFEGLLDKLAAHVPAWSDEDGA